jgi:glycosyltransferase involved in cell wall biosynthesis
VIADAHWQKADGIAYQLQKLLLRLGRRLTVQVQPHSVEETVVYHELFGIPREQLRAVPWSTTLMGHDVSPAKPEEAGEFVLTGGTSFRDYPTLLEAVRGLDLHLKIGVPQRLLSRGLADRLSGFPNVSVHTNWTNAQFIRQMASCRVFALPIQPGLTRSTADQTILNAMYFGKIVVATDSIGPRIYIKDGVNGFLVPEASVSRWRETLEKVQRLSDNELAEIGRRAAYDARVRFNEPLLLVRTLEEALDAAP